MGVAVVSDDDMARQKSAIERLGCHKQLRYAAGAALGPSPYYSWVLKKIAG